MNDSSAGEERASKRLVIAIAAAALVLRLPGLSRSLWLDEGFSIGTAAHLDGFDLQRPLYFLFLKAWMLLGQSEIWLRLPSVVFGVAGVVVLHALGRRLLGEKVAAMASFLMAISYAEIDHASEARMYTLAPLLLLGACWALLSWVEKGRALSLTLYALSALAALLTFPFCALGLGPPLLAALWRVRASGRRVATLVVVTALPFLVWTPFLLAGLRHPEGSAWLSRPSLSAPLGLHGWALLGIGPCLAGWPACGQVLRLASLALAAVAGLGALSSPLGRRIGLAFYGALALVLAMSMVKPLWLPRYFMPLVPAVFVLAALGLDRLGRWRSRVGLASFVALAGLAVATDVAVALAAPAEDWRAAAACVAPTPDEAVVVFGGSPLPGSGKGIWDHYYPGPTRYLEHAEAIPAEVEALGRPTWLVVRTIDPGLYGRMPRLVQALEARFEVTRPCQPRVIDVYRLWRRPAQGAPPAGP
jgi:hypothetical protein